MLQPAKPVSHRGYLLGDPGVFLCAGQGGELWADVSGLRCVLYFRHGVGFVLKRIRDYLQFKPETAYLLVFLFEKRS